MIGKLHFHHIHQSSPTVITAWINLSVHECFRALQVEIQLISTDTLRRLTAGALPARMRGAHICLFAASAIAEHLTTPFNIIRPTTALNFNNVLETRTAPAHSAALHYRPEPEQEPPSPGCCYLSGGGGWLTGRCPIGLHRLHLHLHFFCFCFLLSIISEALFIAGGHHLSLKFLNDETHVNIQKVGKGCLNLGSTQIITTKRI